MNVREITLPWRPVNKAMSGATDLILPSGAACYKKLLPVGHGGDLLYMVGLCITATDLKLQARDNFESLTAYEPKIHLFGLCDCPETTAKYQANSALRPGFFAFAPKAVLLANWAATKTLQPVPSICGIPNASSAPSGFAGNAQRATRQGVALFTVTEAAVPGPPGATAVDK